MKFSVLSVGLFLIMTQGVVSYRFLGLFPLPIQSHFFVFEKLMKVLVERGHQVDVLSHFPQDKPFPRYTDINVAGSLPSVENNVSVKDALNNQVWDSAFCLFKNYGSDVCENVLKHPETEKLKNSKVKYDAIITEVFGTDCLLGFAHLFEVPVIGVMSTMQLPWGNDRMGNPDNPSYIPNYFIPRSGKMILLRKIEMAIVTVASKVAYHVFSTIPSEMKARDFFGDTMPPLDYIAYNTSLLLVNSHFTIDEPKPNVPGLIEVGGMHIGKPRSLPTDLNNIVQSAKDGVIYFSMGTVLRADTLPEKELKAILDAFSSMTQTILWKGSRKDLPKSLPKNIFVIDWMPQLDILCHPKTKLFISHGGQLSVQEAIHCGVPVLGIPVFADQYLNIINCEKQGAAILLEHVDISTESFLAAMKNLLRNDSYRNHALQLSGRFRDRPANPADTAAYWVEYVVRYEGARHLRTKGADLIWFEYYLIDVALVFLVLALIFMTMFFIFLNIVQNYFDNPLNHQPKEKQK